MPTDFDTTQSAAKIYADSLLDLATQSGETDAIASALADLDTLWREQPAFADMMRSAAVDVDSRRAILKKVFAGRISPLILNLMLVLNDHRRSMILPAVIRSYRKGLDEQRGRREASVVTASPLDDAQRARLREQIQRLVGREAVLLERVDPAILGGMVVQVGDRVYDTSVRSRLAGMQRGLYEAIGLKLRANKQRFVTEK